MTVGQLLKIGRDRLSGFTVNEGRIISGWCLERITGMDAAARLVSAEKTVSDDEAAEFLRSVDRCAGGEPVQYVCGFTEFYGNRIEVGPGVLIPRPETESLVDLVIDSCSEISSPRILDLGTGSGCIAVAIASAIHDSEVWAIDSSNAALVYATKNAADLGVTVVAADFLDPSTMESIPGGFDCVVSNPPYIPESEIRQLSTSITDHEPHEALFVGSDVLANYRAISALSIQKLVIDGLLVVEVHSDYAEAVESLFKSDGYWDVRITTDLAGKNRAVSGRKPGA